MKCPMDNEEYFRIDMVDKLTDVKTGKHTNRYK